MKQDIKHGAAWMVGFRVLDRSLGIVSTAILARILLPEDFGLVAMAMAVVAVMELAAAFSFDIPLIQKSHPTRADYNTAWTLNVLLFGGCGALLALGAIPAARFFDDFRLTQILLIFGSVWSITGLANIGTVDFRREMKFGREFTYMFVRRLVGFLVTMIAAITLRNYWALVIGVATTRIVGVILSYIMSGFRPRVSLISARELISFSSWLLVNNTVIVATVRFPHFVIGRVQGASALGLFTVAYEFATLPVSEIIQPINRVALPAYSRLKDNVAELRATFLEVSASVLFVALPASVGIAIVAEPMVLVILGGNWIEAAPIMVILAASGALIAVQSHNGILHVAVGRPRLNAVLTIVRLIILIPATLMLVSSHGVVGVAYAELLAAFICTIISFYLPVVVIGMSVKRFFTNTWRILTACTVMGIVTKTSIPLLGEINPLVELLLSVSLGAVSYLGTVFLLWFLIGRPDGPESFCMAALRRSAGRFRRLGPG